MNTLQKEIIKELADKAYDARLKFDCLGMMNTPSDPEEKRKSYVEYQLAKAEMINARNLLNKAIEASESAQGTL